MFGVKFEEKTCPDCFGSSYLTSSGLPPIPEVQEWM